MAKPQFLWGVSTAAHQIEGDNRHSDWWKWEAAGNIDRDEKSGMATDHWRRFAEDLRLASEMGLTSYRFSVEWAKIEPEEGKWDTAAIEWYRRLVEECEFRKLQPMVTLLHFTLPAWVAEKGGFNTDETPAYFARYVQRIADELGAHVALWCTLNEPMVMTIGGYLGKFMPPAIYSPQAVANVSRNLLRAHVAAYEILHQPRDREGPWRELPVAVGIAQNLLDFKPARSWHPLEVILTRIFARFYNRSWLNAVTGRRQCFGILGLIPKPAAVLEARSRVTCDFIGVNYYTNAYIHWCPQPKSTRLLAEIPLGITFAREGEITTDMDWGINPKGFLRILKFAASFGKPVYVTENGIADDRDDRRVEFLKSHLSVIEEAVAAGMDVRGYYYWSLMDNFEWIKGFAPRFGLFSVDYGTFERTATRGVATYRDWIAQSKINA